MCVTVHVSSGRRASILGGRLGHYHLEESRFAREQWFLWKQEVSVPTAGNLVNDEVVNEQGFQVM